MALLKSRSNGIFKGKGVPDLIAYRTMRYSTRIPCSQCGTATQGALSVNGICFASCAGAACNKAIIAYRLGREANV